MTAHSSSEMLHRLSFRGTSVAKLISLSLFQMPNTLALGLSNWARAEERRKCKTHLRNFPPQVGR
jgi:hypothetical protein